MSTSSTIGYVIESPFVQRIVETITSTHAHVLRVLTDDHAQIVAPHRR